MFLKKQWVAYGLVFALFVISVFSFPSSAMACKCANSGTVLEKIIKSDTVFEGTATSVKTSSLTLFRSSENVVKISFQVNQVWKGHVAPAIEVETTDSESGCGYPFKEGERYVVYAAATGKSLVTTCSGAVLHSDANEHIELLGAGSLPPQPSGTDQQADDSIPLSWYLAFGAIAASTIVFFVFRKRKTSRSRT